MAALARDRNTLRAQGDVQSYPVAVTKIYAGALACLNATGFAVPGTVSTTLKAAGRAEEYVDNTGGAAGDVRIKVRPGVYRFESASAADLITTADVGNKAYILDDQTVAKTDGTGTRSAAGVILNVDSLGVWVRVGF